MLQQLKIVCDNMCYTHIIPFNSASQIQKQN